MLAQLQRQWDERPLLLILWGAFIVRLVAVIWSKGYGMHDDHFLIIEAAQSWIDGYDYNNWLPQNRTDGTPTGHSWFYVGIHYYLLSLLDQIGITGAQTKMYFVRFIHALWYLVAIRYTFLITQKIGTRNAARMVTLFMAFLWFLPILGVRNLVEVVCIPPLLIATWLLIKEDVAPFKSILLAGVFLGIAVAVRFQTVLFLGGFGLVLLLQKRVLGGVLLGIAFIAALFLTQIGDLFLWGKPFAEFTEYIRYNFANKTTYFSRPWYMYFGTIGGLVLPPLSLFLYVGWFKMIQKKYLMILLPSFIFFAFHSYFPNKQERFILPFIPYFLMLGYVGWEKILDTGKQWILKSDRYGMRFFWGINLILLIAVTPAYSKKSRVETMEYLGAQKDYNGALVEYTTEYGAPMMPRYYASSWKSPHAISKGDDIAERITHFTHLGKVNRASHVIFFEPDNLSDRVGVFEANCDCELTKIHEIQPSYLDQFIHWLNPVNDNETAFIYKMQFKD